NDTEPTSDSGTSGGSAWRGPCAPVVAANANATAPMTPITTARRRIWNPPQAAATTSVPFAHSCVWPRRRGCNAKGSRRRCGPFHTAAKNPACANHRRRALPRTSGGHTRPRGGTTRAPSPGMDTSTSYLGLRLAHPFIAGASPMGYSVDTIKRLEDGGCAAIVLHSLFEEQISLATEGRV